MQLINYMLHMYRMCYYQNKSLAIRVIHSKLLDACQLYIEMLVQLSKL